MNHQIDDYIEIVIPMTEQGSSPIYIGDGAMRTLSQYEDRDKEIVLQDIWSIGFDVVRSIIPTDSGDKEGILLKIAADYIDNAKNLLAATANSEIQPDPYFLRVRERAKEYAENCRFGHTFRGSFGFTIESPISPNVEPPLFPEAHIVPFERKVVQRLAQGLRQVRDAEREKDIGKIVAGFKSGFSANSCERLAELLENIGSSREVVFEISLSKEWPDFHSVAPQEHFGLGIPHIEVTKEAAKALRHQTLPKSETVVGRVVRLAANDPTELLEDREVVVKWPGETGDILVRIKLEQQEYLAAVDAHKSGNKISISGTLEQRGRRWVLQGPTGFVVVAD